MASTWAPRGSPLATHTLVAGDRCVDVHAASFLEVDKPQPVVLYEVVKGFLTGSTPEIGEMHHIEHAIENRGA